MFKVDRETCIACMQCIKDCPAKVISLEEGKAYIHNDNCIKCGHCVAICPVKAVSTDDYDMGEVIKYDKEAFYVDSENLLNFIKFRRSIRRYKDMPVEKEKLDKIIEAGRFTQTSRNLQDVSYTVVTENVDKLKELAYQALKTKGEYILANLTPETEYLKRYAELWIHSYNSYKEDPVKNDRLMFNAPAAIFVTSKTPINGGLASADMSLMTYSLGLGTFFSGFLVAACQDNKDLLDFLGIENSKEIISCIVVGYPDVKYQRTAPRGKANVKWL